MKLMANALRSFKFGTAAIAVVIGSFALFLGVARSAAAPVRVAYSAISGAMGPLWVASRHGDLQPSRTGCTAALHRRRIGGDPGASRRRRAVCAPWRKRGRSGFLRGADLKMIANTINRLVFKLMSKPEVKSAADLKGKTIGVTRLGGSTDFALDLALKKWGLRRGTDVAVLQTGGMPQLLGAIQSGPIDAGVISPPTNLQAQKLGLRELVDFGDLEIPYPNSPLAAMQSHLAKNRDLVLRFLRAYAEGIQRVKTDRNNTMKIFSKYTAVKEPEILAELYQIYGVKYLERIPFVSADAVEAVLQTEVKSGSAKAADFIDNSFISEMDREGFFRQLYR